jgi:hypothetical protein
MLRDIVDRLFGRVGSSSGPDLTALKIEPLRSWSDQYPDVPKPGPEMSIELIAVRWTCHDLYGEDMPQIAADLLEQGFDSQSLRRLAGEIEATCSADVEPLVANAVREFGFPYPMPEEQARLIFARQLARQVIAGQRDPWPAAYDLECIMRAAYPANEDLASLFGLNDEWKWNEQERTTSELIETFARLGSMSDAEIFSAH